MTESRSIGNLKVICLLKFILGLTNWYENRGLTNEAAAKADDLGFWGISMPDHYLRATGTRDGGALDSWLALAHLASKTNAIHAGTMVTPIPFRPPALLAKMVSTLDVISDGRTFLGVGDGWWRREFEAYGEWADEPGVRLAGKYGDIVFLPPDMKKHSLNEAKDIVLNAAKESKRTTKVSFVAGSLVRPP